MANKKRRNDDEEAQGDEFSVELVTAARVTEDASGWEYMTKWAGYPDSENTWEPPENLKKCNHLMERFWNVVPTDNEDYPPAYTVTAPTLWVATLREKYRKEHPADAEAEDERARRSGEPLFVPPKKRRTRSTKRRTRGYVYSDEEGYKDPPPRKSARLNKSITAASKSDASQSSSSEEDSEDDQPLSALQKRDTDKTKTWSIPQSSTKASVTGGGQKKPVMRASESLSPDIPLRSLASRSSRVVSTKRIRESSPESSSPPPPPKQQKVDKPTTTQQHQPVASSSRTKLSINIPANKGSSTSGQVASPVLKSASSTMSPLTFGPRPIQKTHKDRLAKPLVQALPPGFKVAAGIGAKSRLVQVSQHIKKPDAKKYQGLSMRTKAAAAQGASTSVPIQVSPVQPKEPLPSNTDNELFGDDIYGGDDFDGGDDGDIMMVDQSPPAATSPILRPSGSIPSLPPNSGSTSMTANPRPTFTQLPQISPSAPQQASVVAPPAANVIPASIIDKAAALSIIDTVFKPNKGLQPSTAEPAKTLLVERPPMVSPTLQARPPPIFKPSSASPILPAIAPRITKITPFNAAIKPIPFSDSWRFNTDLFMDNEADNTAERLCSITISDVESSNQSDARHLKYFLGDSSSIRMKKVYSDQMLEIAHRGILTLQYARVRAQTEEDGPLLGSFTHYLHTERRMVIADCPMSLGDTAPHSLLIFPTSPDTFLRKHRPPSSFKLPSPSEGPGIVLALITYQRPKLSLSPTINSSNTLAVKNQDTKMVPSAIRITQAMGLTPELLSHFRGKTFSILDNLEAAANTSKIIRSDSPETLALVAMIDGVEKHPMSMNEDMSIMFIHNRVWRQLFRVRSIPNRLLQPNFRFYCYGPSADIDQASYRLREVLQCGGVVTFTARAIAERPMDIEGLMARIHVHPLWTSYVLPTVVACVDHLTTMEPDEGGDLQDKATALWGVLGPLMQRQTELVPVMPLNKGIDALLEWEADRMQTEYFGSVVDLLEHCKGIFADKYPLSTESDDVMDIEPSTSLAAHPDPTPTPTPASPPKPPKAVPAPATSSRWGLPRAAQGAWGNDETTAGGWDSPSVSWGDPIATDAPPSPPPPPPPEVEDKSSKGRQPKTWASQEVEKAVEEEVWQDLSRLLQLSAVREEYRHFVVISSEKELNRKLGDQGIRRMTLAQFLGEASPRGRPLDAGLQAS